MSALSTFEHRQAAHCESGVVSSLVTHHGLPLSEPMAFGLASALTYAYIPLVKLSGLPLIAYRMPPRAILKGVSRQLGLRIRYRTFRDPDAGMAALDAALDAGQPVGLQTSVFWLPYFPEGMRFHFNAHNLLVVGRDGDDYLVSDPVFETLHRCEAGALRKARFAKGALAAKGLMYHLERPAETIDYARVVPRAIRRNHRIMTKAPLPFIGLRGIRGLGKTLIKLQKRPSTRESYLPLMLGHIVRMQEEIGTGGAGFRFMYAAFLREAASRLGDDTLAEASHRMTDAGDEWRLFALRATRMAKGRETMDTTLLADILHRCADREAVAWQRLQDVA